MKKSILVIIVSLMYVGGFATQFSNESRGVADSDEEGLLFMFEEEKLARDVYVVLYDLWGANQFNNISNSEQSHMNTLEALLIELEVSYTILPPGEYSNTDLQSLYDDLIALGSNNLVDAFVVGMTIEDVDVFDLQAQIAVTENEAIIAAYELLMCGSTNHMRAFHNGLTNNGGSYAPQYITVEEYEEIINGTNVECGTVGIEDIETLENILSNTIVKDDFSVLLPNKSTVHIYSTNGALIRSLEVEGNQSINMKEYTTGIYFVKVVNNSKTYMIKVLKE